MSTIKSDSEDLTLNAHGSGNDIKFQSNASEVAEITDGGVLSSTGGSTHADNVKAKFGTGNDLEIYHDASHSFISDQGTGSLKILANTLEINNAANNEAMAGFTQDGAVTLYHNDVAKFETIAGGARIPSGGLLFGSDTAAANALDDYEEGTWTPANQWIAITNEVAARYTKIGNMVTVWGNISWASTPDDVSQSGGKIQGLPFTPAGGDHPVLISWWEDITTGVKVSYDFDWQIQNHTTIVGYDRVNSRVAQRAQVRDSHMKFQATYQV